MFGTAVPGHFWAIFVKNVTREIGQIRNISFWPLFTKLGKNAKNGKICGGKQAHRYMWQLGHLLPTFCSKMPLFPQFYSKNGSKKFVHIWTNFLHFFGSSVSVLSINSWRILECEPKKLLLGVILSVFWENLLLAGEMLKTAKAIFNISLATVILIFKKCFWLGKC